MENPRRYLPCLRWKTGEYQALSQLYETTKDSILPIIEVPEIGFDFENWTVKSTIDEHLEKFPKRLSQKWGGRTCFVDLIHCSQPDMLDGRHPVTYVFDELRNYNCKVMPVTGVGRDRKYQKAVKEILRRDSLRICLRVTLEEATASTIQTDLDSLFRELERDPKESYLVLDLGAPNFVPVSGFSRLVGNVLHKFPHIDDWKSLAMIGSSFPESMAELMPGINVVPRREWELYQSVVEDLFKMGHQIPAFGDYAVNHPFIIQVDMRIVKPSASVRYAVEDAWIVVKGSNVRDHGFGQYRELCQVLRSSERYDGVLICEGDNFIVECADGGNTSNLTGWRRVGTSRHLAKVAADVSTFYGS